MIDTQRFVSGALLLILLTPCVADAECLRLPSDRPRIGLALGGGGARGGAHLGVLKVLEELRVPIDGIAGTSMGAIVGGLYASGMSARDIEAAVENIDWSLLFNDRAARSQRSFRRKRDDDLALFAPKLGYRAGEFILPEGVLVGQKIDLFFERLTLPRTQTRDFDKLPIPFRAIATDIVTAQEVVIASGSLARAMRTSMSIPGVLAPITSGEQLLVDGGIANNLPVNVVQEVLDADIVIAVSVSSGLLRRDEITDLLGVIDQLSNIMVHNSNEVQKQRITANDILIEPELGRFATTDFENIPLAIAIGADAARQAGERLQTLALSPTDYRAYRQAIAACQSTPPKIDFVQLENRSLYSDEVIRARLRQRTGQVLDIDALEQDIARIHGVGNLRQVRYELVENQGASGLLVHAESQRRAPNYIEYGLDLSGDGSHNNLNIKLGYLKTALDDIGTEWRSVLQIGEEPALLTELYKPFAADSPYYLQPRFSLARSRVNLFDGRDDPLAQLRITSALLELTAGKELNNTADLSLGLRYGHGETKVDIGDPNLPTPSFDVGIGFLRYRYDTFDDRFIPSYGHFGAFELRAARTMLGDEENYEQIALSYFAAHTWHRRHTLIVGTQLNTTLDEDAPTQALFRAGGFAQLSGFELNELSGQHFGMLMGGYRYEIGRTGLLPAYIGFGLELGNTWQRREDISADSALLNANVYFAYRSPIGPVYLGYGAAEGGHNSIFLSIGSVFGD